MKDKILMLVIGVLIGAIITAGCFMLFGKNDKARGEFDRKNMDANMIDRGQMGRPSDENNLGEPPTIVNENVASNDSNI